MAAVRELETDADRAYTENRDGAGDLYALADSLQDVVDGLSRGGELLDEGAADDILTTVQERLDAVAAGGDLRALLDAAVDAVRGEAPDGLLEAAATALRGGRDGCRELAIFADDGYAHPNAWALLAAAIATPEADSVREISTESFAFDRKTDGGGRFKRLQQNGATIAADRNHHGAIVVDSPAFTDRNGCKCPVVGLDATGRTELWRQAIGRDTQRRDIHRTDAARRRFLREAVDLTVVQTTEKPLPYHSDPTGKNFQEDLEIVETAAEEYTGGGGGALDEKGPAVISTKKVLNYLGDDIDQHAGATVNYENMKGSDDLGEHQVLVALGSQHYGDAVPEKWALVAGESAGRGDTRGETLDYGSEVANAYLNICARTTPCRRFSAPDGTTTPPSPSLTPEHSAPISPSKPTASSCPHTPGGPSPSPPPPNSRDAGSPLATSPTQWTGTSGCGRFRTSSRTSATGGTSELRRRATAAARSSTTSRRSPGTLTSSSPESGRRTFRPKTKSRVMSHTIRGISFWTPPRPLLGVMPPLALRRSPPAPPPIVSRRQSPPPD